MLKPFVAAILLLASLSASAGRVFFTGTIQELNSYSEQPGFDGDIAVRVANPPPGCEGGFWLRSADTRGYKSTVALLVSAFHAGTSVTLGGLDHEIWTGSQTRYCRLDQIFVVK